MSARGSERQRRRSARERLRPRLVTEPMVLRKLLMSLRISLFKFAVVIVLTIPASAAPCAELAKVSIAGVSITSATDVAAGHFTIPGSEEVLDTPAFCRVIGVASTTSDSVINFEVWIPSGERWNYDFLGVGNGGYNGVIEYAELADGLTRGFATASTDTGHKGTDLAFAAGHPEKTVDWGYRAVHVMTESAKLIIHEYYSNHRTISRMQTADSRCR